MVQYAGSDYGRDKDERGDALFSRPTFAGDLESELLSAFAADFGTGPC